MKISLVRLSIFPLQKVFEAIGGELFCNIAPGFSSYEYFRQFTII